MPERFTETLRAASEPGWSHAVGHRFVKKLFTGAVPDAVMARYLIRDHRFLDSFLMLLGAALASADTFAARLRFGRFIGMKSGEENTYFLRPRTLQKATGHRDPSTTRLYNRRGYKPEKAASLFSTY
jgi:thiaminase (transcriptional activator TenA)